MQVLNPAPLNTNSNQQRGNIRTINTTTVNHAHAIGHHQQMIEVTGESDASLFSSGALIIIYARNHTHSVPSRFLLAIASVVVSFYSFAPGCGRDSGRPSTTCNPPGPGYQPSSLAFSTRLANRNFYSQAEYGLVLVCSSYLSLKQERLL